MIRNRISLFVATFLIIGFFFLALPENTFSGTGMTPNGPEGCCAVVSQGCENLANMDICDLGGGDFFPGEECIDGSCVSPAAVSAVPTLSEWGLLAMAGVLGIVGFMVMRRRKVSA